METTPPDQGAETPRFYEKVLDSIEKDLQAGRLKLGGRLPPERTMAEIYGISRASVRDAIRILSAIGIVRTSVGAGPDSGAIVISEPAAGLSSALRFHVATRRLPVADIVATRLLLETWAAGSIVSSEGLLDRLEPLHRLLEEMDDPDIDRETFHALDVQFHVTLSSLGQNAVVVTMMEALSGAIREYVREAMDGIDVWPQIRGVLRNQHHAIFDAVLLCEGEKAAVLLKEHIEWFYEKAREL